MNWLHLAHSDKQTSNNICTALKQSRSRSGGNEPACSDRRRRRRPTIAARRERGATERARTHPSTLESTSTAPLPQLIRAAQQRTRTEFTFAPLISGSEFLCLNKFKNLFVVWQSIDIFNNG